MALEPLHVEGLNDLRRAFRLASKELSKELRESLRDVAKPVKDDAFQLALEEIPRIGLPWAEMRVGVTRAGVYVAPKKRGVKTRGRDPRRRPNLFDLLLDRALTPALERNHENIVGDVERMLETVGKKWERV